MIRTFLSLILSATFFCSRSQPTSDALDKSEYLFDLNVFKTSQEKQLFSEIASGKNIDYLNLFILSDPSSNPVTETPKDKIETFFSSSDALHQQDFNAKRLKKVYSDIHNSFLNKYVDNPGFGELFSTGNYNCATATALYTLLLDKTSIAYNIRETPQHVYIVAAPETYNLIFETTAPGAKFLDLNEKSKNQFLEYLYNNKIISKGEWTSGDKNELFKKFFFNDSVINKRQLAGLLYYNAGVDAIGKENFNEGYKNFEKAYFLYPCQKIRYFVIISLASLLVEDKMKNDPDAYMYYLRFSDISDRDISKTMLGGYYDEIGQKLLFKSSDPQKYWQLYNRMIPHISDTTLRKDIQSAHYYNIAHYFSIKSKYDSSLLYLDSVYTYNKNDLLIQELITNNLLEVLRGITNEKKAYDSLNTIFKRYPFIDRQSRLGEYYFYCLSRVTVTAFQNDHKKEGDEYLQIIYNLIETQPELKKKGEPYFTEAFSGAYSYFMGRSKYKEAKDFLTSVMKFYPDNEDLQRQMKFVLKILD
jgi:hypothetical protein